MYVYTTWIPHFYMARQAKENFEHLHAFTFYTCTFREYNYNHYILILIYYTMLYIFYIDYCISYLQTICVTSTFVPSKQHIRPAHEKTGHLVVPRKVDLRVDLRVAPW